MAHKVISGSKRSQSAPPKSENFAPKSTIWYVFEFACTILTILFTYEETAFTERDTMRTFPEKVLTGRIHRPLRQWCRIGLRKTKKGDRRLILPKN